jgi:hypothetical protein
MGLLPVKPAEVLLSYAGPDNSCHDTAKDLKAQLCPTSKRARQYQILKRPLR